MGKNSIQEDIGSGVVTPKIYVKNVLAYVKVEQALLKKAQDDGLDSENLALIEGRIQMAKNEAKSITDELTGQA